MENQNFNAIPLLQSALDKGNLLLSQTKVTEAAVGGWETGAQHAIMTVFGGYSPFVKRFMKKTFHVGPIPDQTDRDVWRREQLQKQVSILVELLDAAKQQKELLTEKLPQPTARSSKPIAEEKAVMSSSKLHGFIASSVQGLTVARAVESNLHKDCELVVWDQGAFEPSGYPIESLVNELDQCDFGIFIFNPDDTVQIGNSQGGTQVTVRDNVILELGLFIGRLGRKRVFIVRPSNVPNFRLPSDLLGLTALSYDPNRKDGKLRSALGAACNDIRTALETLGPFEPRSQNASTTVANPRPSPISVKQSVVAAATDRPPSQVLKRKEISKLVRSFQTMIHTLDDRTEATVTNFISLDGEAAKYVAKHFPELSGYDRQFPLIEKHITQKIHKAEDIEKYKAMCEDRLATLKEILEVL